MRLTHSSLYLLRHYCYLPLAISLPDLPNSLALLVLPPLAGRFMVFGRVYSSSYLFFNHFLLKFTVRPSFFNQISFLARAPFSTIRCSYRALNSVSISLSRYSISTFSLTSPESVKSIAMITNTSATLTVQIANNMKFHWQASQ